MEARSYDADTDYQPLDSYAWPGGYPIIYVDTDNGDVFCGKHVWPIIVREDAPMVRDIYYEGADEWCAEGSHAIPSAYGDPDDLDSPHNPHTHTAFVVEN